MKRIDIKAPFYGAGSPKQFGWVKDGFNIYGIGLKVDDVNGHRDLIVGYDGNSYIIRTQDIKDFTYKYNSYYQVKNSSVRLAVFSVSLLNNLYIE